MGFPNSTNESEELYLYMSSLNNKDAKKMWLGSKHININQTESSQQVLQYLLRDNGFINIDGLLKTHLPIAAKASNFATCAWNGKVGYIEATFQLCEACNHVGKFGRMATTEKGE